MSRAEENALLRLATAPMPTASSVYAGNRRDVVAEDEARIQVALAMTSVRRHIAIRLAWAVRRLRRELGL